jgi:hypothetical protein
MFSAMGVGDFLKFGDRDGTIPATALSRVAPRHPIIKGSFGSIPDRDYWPAAPESDSFRVGR